MTSSRRYHPADDERVFGPSDLREQAGLSYRQIHDWASKGVLPPVGRPQRGWRKFRARELFVILVCAELRRQFGASSHQLRWLQKIMLQNQANHFKAAVDMMDKLGLAVFIATDFRETFIMQHEIEFGDLWTMGGFGTDNPAAHALLKVNPLINQILQLLGEPLELKTHGRFRDVWLGIEKSLRARTPQEIHLLRLARSADYTKIEVSLKDGSIEKFCVDESPDAGNRRRVPVTPDGAGLDFDPEKTLLAHRVDLTGKLE